MILIIHMHRQWSNEHFAVQKKAKNDKYLGKRNELLFT